VWIRIRGSMPLTNGIRIRILLFSPLTFKTPTKNKFKKKFLLLEGTFTSFFKDKNPKEVTKQ
jgi:hypothetical protein